jgi:hypothetical protein
LYKQFRASSPTQIDKRLLVLEKAKDQFDEHRIEADLALVQLKDGVTAMKEQVSKLDEVNGEKLGEIRDTLTRMESRIDDLYKANLK